MNPPESASPESSDPSDFELGAGMLAKALDRRFFPEIVDFYSRKSKDPAPVSAQLLLEMELAEQVFAKMAAFVTTERPRLSAVRASSRQDRSLSANRGRGRPAKIPEFTQTPPLPPAPPPYSE